jgi:nitrite reductase/ring-hydroxylating ferredoxin subunit
MHSAHLPHPDGWYQVGYSNTLAVDDVQPRRYFGEELVLFRAEDGTAQLFDAFCAHLGAHLGHGGHVEGNCIRCPFHSWKYDVTGECVEIPYATRIPKGAAVRAWAVRETSGIIYAWYSSTDTAPSWEPPSLAEHDQDGWVGYDCHHFVLPSIPQEVVENIFDVAHGQYVHDNAQGTAPAEVDFSFDGPRAVASFSLDLPLVGGKTTHVAEIYGLGIVVNHSAGFGTKAFVSNYTPIDEGSLEVNFSFMTPASTDDDPTGERSRASALATVNLFAQDIPIWEHKTYRPTPLLCDGDVPIGRYRRWARQFYPAGVPGVE